MWTKICLHWTSQGIDKVVSLFTGHKHPFRPGCHPQGEITNRIAEAGEKAICTSIIAAAELRFGAENSGSGKLVDRVDLILSAIEILPLETPADREYGKLRHYLARQGTLIGQNDMLIAAQALGASLTMVTANTREFSRVPGLVVENWLTE